MVDQGDGAAPPGACQGRVATTRGELKHFIFDYCDADRDGHLSIGEMRKFASLSGFDGDDEDWREEYFGLCRGHRVHPAFGIPRDVVYTMLEDDGPNGLLMSDKDLRKIVAACGGCVEMEMEMEVAATQADPGAVARPAAPGVLAQMADSRPSSLREPRYPRKVKGSALCRVAAKRERPRSLRERREARPRRVRKVVGREGDPVGEPEDNCWMKMAMLAFQTRIVAVAEHGLNTVNCPGDVAPSSAMSATEGIASSGSESEAKEEDIEKCLEKDNDPQGPAALLRRALKTTKHHDTEGVEHAFQDISGSEQCENMDTGAVETITIDDEDMAGADDVRGPTVGELDDAGGTAGCDLGEDANRGERTICEDDAATITHEQFDEDGYGHPSAIPEPALEIPGTLPGTPEGPLPCSPVMSQEHAASIVGGSFDDEDAPGTPTTMLPPEMAIRDAMPTPGTPEVPPDWPPVVPPELSRQVLRSSVRELSPDFDSEGSADEGSLDTARATAFGDEVNALKRALGSVDKRSIVDVATDVVTVYLANLGVQAVLDEMAQMFARRHITRHQQLCIAYVFHEVLTRLARSRDPVRKPYAKYGMHFFLEPIAVNIHGLTPPERIPFGRLLDIWGRANYYSLATIARLHRLWGSYSSEKSLERRKRRERSAARAVDIYRKAV